MTDEKTTKADASASADDVKVESASTETTVDKDTKIDKIEEPSLPSNSQPLDSARGKLSQPSTPSAKFKNLIETIEKLSVLELSELVKELEERFGVSAAAPVAMVAVGAAAAPVEAEEEKDSFTVVIKEAGAQKIAVIKAVRELKQDLGLVEAKNLVEKGNAELLKDVKKEEATAAKAKLEAAGASIELK